MFQNSTNNHLQVIQFGYNTCESVSHTAKCQTLILVLVCLRAFKLGDAMVMLSGFFSLSKK